MSTPSSKHKRCNSKACESVIVTTLPWNGFKNVSTTSNEYVDGIEYGISELGAPCVLKYCETKTTHACEIEYDLPLNEMHSQ
jgi:hypothetical protein